MLRERGCDCLWSAWEIAIKQRLGKLRAPDDLAVQAKLEGLTVVTGDAAIGHYGVPTLAA